MLLLGLQLVWFGLVFIKTVTELKLFSISIGIYQKKSVQF
jgi:hypothetical protein